MSLIGIDEAESLFTISRWWFYHRRGGKGVPLTKHGKYLMLDSDAFMAWLNRECLVLPKGLRRGQDA